MFRSRRRSIERDDSWHWAKNGYLAQFESHISHIATLLEIQGLPKLHSKYYVQGKHAQLVALDGQVAARIKITGECCMPTTADVTLVNLPVSAEDIFRFNLWPLLVRFTHVSYLREDEK